VTTFPAEALLGTLDPLLAPLGHLLAGTALYASHRFWHFAVHHYTSASS
jgi:ABC-2 type transport system permease protein